MLACPSCSCAIFTGTLKSDIGDQWMWRNWCHVPPPRVGHLTSGIAVCDTAGVENGGGELSTQTRRVPGTVAAGPYQFDRCATCLTLSAQQLFREIAIRIKSPVPWP
jgi:hypothetical protein